MEKPLSEYGKSTETISVDFDFLAIEEPKDPPLFKSQDASLKSVIVSSMRNEGLLITEWVAHYKVLGFDRIIIYSNSNDDLSGQMLDILHDAGIVEHIHNEVAPGLSPQMKAFRHAFYHNRTVAAAEWCTFLDADEFLIPVVENKIVGISDFIDVISQTYGADGVALNWRWFGGDTSFNLGDGLVMERFRTASWNDHVKTLFRLRAANSIAIHTPIYSQDAKVIGADGEARALPSASQSQQGSLLGQVNHYWNRTFVEFYVKRQRGRGAVGDGSKRDWADFFKWGVGSNGVDPWPDQDHLGKVKAEMSRIRKIDGYAEAEAEMIDLFQSLTQKEEIRRLYDEHRPVMLED
ncbi:glycosyltransferase family 2 protein [Sphingobium agri]|uniref:Glycosyltransferase family 2 protein n=1 Tax=Sphingobium agri TaxID=2933566 RepID=A0ABT0E1Y5_9SPHN|nr:glycosyltransferase family 2 protein [Sphingobium agri]MCK0533328.1 glycosyltransferase family 2 protein [Sphingobium agri]